MERHPNTMYMFHFSTTYISSTVIVKLSQLKMEQKYSKTSLYRHHWEKGILAV